MELLTNVIGFMAAVVGTGLMLPQVIKTIKTRKVKDVSFLMLFFYFLNCFLWLIYGVLILSWPIMICNFLALIISIIQLVLKVRYS